MKRALILREHKADVTASKVPTKIVISQDSKMTVLLHRLSGSFLWSPTACSLFHFLCSPLHAANCNKEGFILDVEFNV